jgi:hypothetical protein
MTVLRYEKEISALVLVDPYNDFISEGGKILGPDQRRCRSKQLRSEYAADNSEINLMDGDGDAAFYFLRETDDVPIR